MKGFQILYEDNHLIIVNKDAGILVQGDQTGDRTLGDRVKSYIKNAYDKPGNVYLGIVHRLDRPVSGLVVLAKTSKALERMNKLFSTRKVNKTYWALVKRRPPKDEDTLTHWIIKDGAKNKVKAYDQQEEGAKKAVLHYRTLGKMNDHYLLEVRPVTGRPHQIRVQLASMGCPIRGDIKYGFPKPNADKSIHLHARRIDFVHPVKKEPITITAGVPNTEFWEQFLALDDRKIKDRTLDYLY